MQKLQRLLHCNLDKSKAEFSIKFQLWWKSHYRNGPPIFIPSFNLKCTCIFGKYIGWQQIFGLGKCCKKDMILVLQWQICFCFTPLLVKFHVDKGNCLSVSLLMSSNKARFLCDLFTFFVIPFLRQWADLISFISQKGKKQYDWGLFCQHNLR